MIEYIVNYAEYAALLYTGLMLGFPILATLKAYLMGKKAYPIAKIVLGVPYSIANWTFNMTVMTPVFWDLPKSAFEMTTTRMKRYKKLSGRKLAFANYACNWMNKFDEGHC